MNATRPRFYSAAFGAAAIMALSGVAASAAPAYVTTTTNLRSAPGTTNAIIGKVPGGSKVEISNCTEGWCEITWQGKNGFAIQTALDASGKAPPQRSAVRSRPRTAAVATRGAPRPAAVYEDDDEYEVAGPAYYGAPGVYRYPYYAYRPFGYYRYRPFYGYGWRRGWRRW